MPPTSMPRQRFFLLLLGAWVGACGVPQDSVPVAEEDSGGLPEDASALPPPNDASLSSLDAAAGEDAAVAGDSGPSVSVCKSGGDCESGVCTLGVCQSPTSSDGVKNGNESGVDCGKSGIGVDTKAPLCADGAMCAEASDCSSSVCIQKSCAVPTSSDGTKNGNETGIDCGRAAVGTNTNAPPCADGTACESNTDCVGLYCAANVCTKPTASDGVKNGNETDVDCGSGPLGINTGAPVCLPGQGCLAGTDCTSAICGGDKKCTTPTSTDGKKNGNETDIDCGASGTGFDTQAPKCAEDKACKVNTDCATAGCSPSGVCTARSCGTAETAGIVTCGAGEVDSPTKSHESCCRSLKLPTSNKRLDKYEITAGRFRTFISAVGPDVRTWVSQYAQANATSQLAKLVALNSPLVTNLYPSSKVGAVNLIAHLGAIDMDNYNGRRGCDVSIGGYGHATYWQSNADLSYYGVDPRIQSREALDVKPLNCVMPIMLAAFCAWDGGEMPLLTEYREAWGAANYPWGSTDILRPNYLWCNGTVGTGGWTCQDTNLGGGGVFYQYPAGGIDLSRDLSPWIAAPGRFPADATVLKSSTNNESWMDLFGDMSEYTGDFQATTATFCDFSAAPAPGATTCTRSLRPGLTGTLFSNIPKTGIIGRSWEGHNYGRGSTNAFEATFQYGKFGSRCVRPTK